MPIEDLISSLEDEAREELEELRSEKKREYQELKQEYEEGLEAKKEELQNKLEDKLQSYRENEEKKAEAILQKKVLERKRELLENFKREVLKKLKGLEVEKRKQLLEKLIKKLPESEAGVLRADKNSLSLLKDGIVENKEIEISQEPLEREGLYFQAPDREMDLTFRHLVEVVFDNNEDTLNKILFEQKKAI